MSGNTDLIALIHDRIASRGPVSFRWFMEQALYHPQHGYYASGRAVIGREGDFFTSVSVGALFGKLLAVQFREIWALLGHPSPFTLVEQGANNGDFAGDVLGALRSASPDCFAALRYVIIEPFEPLRDRQKRTLQSFPQVRWHESLNNLEPFCGVHFSNELLDSMPVHLVRFSEGKWSERYVNELFEFIDGPLSSEALEEALAPVPRLENYQTEVNLGALAWIQSLAAKLTRGYVLAVDYGYPQEIYYSPERTTGTLAGYVNHQNTEKPLEDVGTSDLTAHVDFTRVAVHAEKHGFELAGFTDQHHFMVGLGSREFQDSSGMQTPDQQKTLRAFQTLMHPNFMGLAFKVLALRKGVESAPLSGFQFARNPRLALGLE